MATRRERLQNEKGELLISEFNKIISEANRAVQTCDAECLKKSNKSVLKKRFNEAKKNLEDAPYNLRSAKRNYYVYSYGQNTYNQIKEKQIKKKADELAENLTVNHNEFMYVIDNNLKNYENSMDYYKNMLAMFSKFDMNNDEMTTTIEKQHNSYFLNARRVNYENEALENMEIYNRVSLIIYFFVFLLYTIFFVFFGLHKKRVNLFVLIFAGLFPFFIHFIIYSFIMIKNYMKENVTTYNVYLNGSNM